MGQRGIQCGIFRRADLAYLDLHAHLGVGDVPRVDQVAGIVAGAFRAVPLCHGTGIHADVPIRACQNRPIHRNDSVLVALHARGGSADGYRNAAAHSDHAGIDIYAVAVAASNSDVSGNLYRAAQTIAVNADTRCARYGDAAAHRDRAATLLCDHTIAVLAGHRNIAGNTDHATQTGTDSRRVGSALCHHVGDLGAAAAARSDYTAAVAGGGLYIQCPLAGQRHNTAVIHGQRIAGGNVDVERMPVQVEGDALCLYYDSGAIRKARHQTDGVPALRRRQRRGEVVCAVNIPRCGRSQRLRRRKRDRQKHGQRHRQNSFAQSLHVPPSRCFCMDKTPLSAGKNTTIYCFIIIYHFAPGFHGKKSKK